MWRLFKNIILLYIFLFAVACGEDVKPSLRGVFGDEDSSSEVNLDLTDLQAGGEMIILTLYGPDSYFEFRGEDFGNQYKIANEYAKSIGVKSRVDVCRSVREMLEKLKEGDGDLIAYDLPVDSSEDEVIYCGNKTIKGFLDTLAVVERDPSIRTEGDVAWAVRKSSPDLARELKKWLDVHADKLLAMSQPKVKGGRDGRKYTAYVSDEYFPDIPSFGDYPGNGQYHEGASRGGRGYDNSSNNYSNKGKISYYDALFMRYSSVCGWDWHLLAAVAYNESSFNPNAVSPMGAMGLMQLMPSTARQFGVSNAFDPEQSVKASARYFANLMAHYAVVPNPDERINFALAAYNAGPGHVDDARRLAEKRGRDKNVWKGNVDEFVLYMSNPDYYNDPVVKYGYFRGGETYNYVNYIRKDWEKFRNR